MGIRLSYFRVVCFVVMICFLSIRPQFLKERWTARCAVNYERRDDDHSRELRVPLIQMIQDGDILGRRQERNSRNTVRLLVQDYFVLFSSQDSTPSKIRNTETHPIALSVVREATGKLPFRWNSIFTTDCISNGLDEKHL
mmetsp:Transcript_19449/g.54207  ORF Transcript_19449/g.54207 Transcript_19449/m.54207 type:complete len:140 (+) Transcript_19449:207-626(+)